MQPQTASRNQLLARSTRSRRGSSRALSPRRSGSRRPGVGTPRGGDDDRAASIPTGGGDEGDEADNECAPDALARSRREVAVEATPTSRPQGREDARESLGDNVKVNQACENVSDAALAGRGQAQNEEADRHQPDGPEPDGREPERLPPRRRQLLRRISRATAASHWTDSHVPMSFTYGARTWGTARQYWQAGGDTSVAWDTKGNAYISCQVFNRGSAVIAQPRPVERVLRLPLDRQRTAPRGTSRPCRRPSSTTPPEREPSSRTSST